MLSNNIFITQAIMHRALGAQHLSHGEVSVCRAPFGGMTLHLAKLTFPPLLLLLAFLSCHVFKVWGFFLNPLFFFSFALNSLNLFILTLSHPFIFHFFSTFSPCTAIKNIGGRIALAHS